MYCPKCGYQNNELEKYCSKCGWLFENTNQNDYKNIENSKANKYAIFSIIIPVVAIIWYAFIGLSFYLAIIIASIGFGFAKKGEVANKKCAIIGNVLNGILCGLAIVIFIIKLILVFS